MRRAYCNGFVLKAVIEVSWSQYAKQNLSEWLVSFQTIVTLEAENKVTGQTFTEGDLICLKNTREKPKNGEGIVAACYFEKLRISIMKGINPLSFMGKIIQCGWNLSDEVFLTDFSKEFVELEESKAVFIVNASADFSRG